MNIFMKTEKIMKKLKLLILAILTSQMAFGFFGFGFGPLGGFYGGRGWGGRGWWGRPYYGGRWDYGGRWGGYYGGYRPYISSFYW